jgi:integrase
MASFTKLPSGKIRALIRMVKPALSGTFATKAEARSWATQVEADILAGKHSKFPNKTLAQAFDRYAEKVSSGKGGERWELVRLNAFKRHFSALSEFGDVTNGVPFHDIDKRHIVAWRDARMAAVTEGSVAREMTLLRNVFRIACTEWQWTDKNPFEGVRMPRDNPPRTRRPAWREIKGICRSLGYRTGVTPTTKSEEVAHLFLLAMRTALRPSELLRLTDETVDLDRRVLIVKRKTFHETRQLREVPFTRQAARLFRPLKGWGGPLFQVSAASRDALFRKAYKRCMIDGLQFRDSRADAATRLVRKGQVNADS